MCSLGHGDKVGIGTPILAHVAGTSGDSSHFAVRLLGQVVIANLS